MEFLSFPIVSVVGVLVGVLVCILGVVLFVRSSDSKRFVPWFSVVIFVVGVVLATYFFNHTLHS